MSEKPIKMKEYSLENTELLISDIKHCNLSMIFWRAKNFGKKSP